MCWSLSGELLYEHEPADETERIDCCHALNIVGDEAWACPDPNYPIDRVRSDFVQTAWANDLTGAGNIAIASNGRVALVGGYESFRHRLAVVQFGRLQAETLATFQMVMPDGSDLPVDAMIVARGRYINVVAGVDWLRLDLDSVVAA